MFDIICDFLWSVFTNTYTLLSDLINDLYNYALTPEEYIGDVIPSFAALYKVIFRYGILTLFGKKSPSS